MNLAQNHRRLFARRLPPALINDRRSSLKMKMRRVVVVLLVAFCAAVISVPPSAQSGAGAGSSSGQQPTNTPPPQQSDQGGVSMMHPHVSNLQPGQTYHRPSEKEKLKAFAFDTVGPYPICRRGSNGRSSASLWNTSRVGWWRRSVRPARSQRLRN